MEMHHLGSGICSQMRFNTGAILSDTVPATIIRSDWRGLGRNTSAPKRAMSTRAVVLAIISIAQQARPKVSGDSAARRTQFESYANVVMQHMFSILVTVPPVILIE